MQCGAGEQFVLGKRAREDPNKDWKAMSRRRKRGKAEDAVEEGYLEWDDELMAHDLPVEHESVFASMIFELGLRHSSPKVLKTLMPSTEHLTTEHIKSHLQKYRLHYVRSKDEFLDFYEQRLKEKFAQFRERQGWRDLPPSGAVDEIDDGDSDDVTALMDSRNMKEIEGWGGHLMQEHMQLQQIVQRHIMAQISIQNRIHEHLKNVKDDGAAHSSTED
jgi:SHAQKYF class myb-like DNA-binding protein